MQFWNQHNQKYNNIGKNTVINVNNVQLDTVNEYKYLSVLLRGTLTSRPHVGYIIPSFTKFVNSN